MASLNQTVSIMETKGKWHVAADNAAPALTADTEQDLARLVFRERLEVNAVAVIDGKGFLLRTLHRNTHG